MKKNSAEHSSVIKRWMGIHLVCLLISLHLGLYFSAPANSEDIVNVNGFASLTDISVGLTGITFQVTPNFNSMTIPTNAVSQSGDLGLWSVPYTWGFGNWAGILIQETSTIYNYVLDPLNMVTQYSVTDGWRYFPPKDAVMFAGPTETIVSLSIPFASWPGVVSFDLGTTLKYDVFIDGGRSILLDQNASLQSLSIGSGSTLYLSSGFGLNIKDTLNNSGTITTDTITYNQANPLPLEVVNGFNSGTIQADRGNLTINGSMINTGLMQAIEGGTLTLGSSSVINQGIIQASGTGSTLVNYGSLSNQSLMQATGTGSTLINYGAISNQGVMQAVDGGVLTLYGTVANTTSGTIVAGDGSQVKIGGSITGGTLASEGTGIISPT